MDENGTWRRLDYFTKAEMRKCPTCGSEFPRFIWRGDNFNPEESCRNKDGLCKTCVRSLRERAARKRRSLGQPSKRTMPSGVVKVRSKEKE